MKVRSGIRVSFKLAWYDCWVGAFWDRKQHILYVCPIPFCLISIRWGAPGTPEAPSTPQLVQLVETAAWRVVRDLLDALVPVGGYSVTQFRFSRTDEGGQACTLHIACGPIVEHATATTWDDALAVVGRKLLVRLKREQHVSAENPEIERGTPHG